MLLIMLRWRIKMIEVILLRSEEALPDLAGVCHLGYYALYSAFFPMNKKMYCMYVTGNEHQVGLFFSENEELLKIARETTERGYQVLPDGTKGNLKILTKGYIADELFSKLVDAYKKYDFSIGNVPLGFSLNENQIQKMQSMKNNIPLFLKYVLELEKTTGK